MGKSKKTAAVKAQPKGKANLPKLAPAKKTNYTLQELRENRDLWYKTTVLVYDLHNMTKDKSCENRTAQTTDPHYISGPYFSDEEAEIVKNTIIEDEMGTTTIISAVTKRLENFFEKRNASGDFRPCGPHDMAPIYRSCFGIEKEELDNEKFVSRLKRAGLKAT